MVALTEHAVPLRYDEILDTEPIDTAVKLAGAVGDPVGELLGDVVWSPGSLKPGSFTIMSEGLTPDLP